MFGFQTLFGRHMNVIQSILSDVCLGSRHEVKTQHGASKLGIKVLQPWDSYLS